MRAPAPTDGSDKTNKRDCARAAGAARIDPTERETKGQTDRESERVRVREKERERDLLMWARRRGTQNEHHFRGWRCLVLGCS